MDKELTDLDIMVLDGLEGRNELVRDITDFRFPKSDILLWMEKQESFTAQDVCRKFGIPHGSTHCHNYEYKGYIEEIGTFTDIEKKYHKPQKVYAIVR